ncbi:MOSC domain-containing protein [Pseudomonas entomophila]|uniref:MOSC domain-containing protein n=1 Tax=Pseudomonas entomophila TaxID=312306 RepID=UPI0023D802C7|nr:MOSC domain-containing protein [Pseudomonas entomophila]MDF0733193.1 MOSC domain-containing protein [Pseudomonas entomophila]
MITHIEHLFAGGLRELQPEGQRTGIYKHPVVGPALIRRNGIVGDQQADTRVHGGPEKAVHHYAAQNYAALAAAFPECAAELLPGSLGENLSSHGLDERNVHIGDLYRVGSALLQVSQPRSPCWKINHRFEAEKMSMFVVQQHLTGWYYRVIEQGVVEVGDRVTLVERFTERFSIDAFWTLQLLHRPQVEDLRQLSATPGLADEWQARLAGRAEWLASRLG